jgi:hypothetical protein
MNGQCWFGGVSPQVYLAFSLEETPTCGRASSRTSTFLHPFIKDGSGSDKKIKN